MAKENRSRSMSFSSETPVRRWFGWEILDHGPSSVRMGFMSSGRAPLLLNHDMRQQIGIIEKASVVKKRVPATARFGRMPLAEEALMNVDDGILVNTSVGYRIHELRFESTKDEVDTYRIVDWEPYEGSLVAVPADPEVGVDRAADDVEVIEDTNVQTGDDTMKGSILGSAIRATLQAPDNGAGSGGGSGGDNQNRGNDGNNGSPGDNEIRNMQQQQLGMSALEIDRQRVAAIKNLAKLNNFDERMERQWISSGMSIEKVSEDMLAIIQKRGEEAPRPESMLGLTDRETQNFSIIGAIRACADKDWTKAGFEAECSRAIAQKLGRAPDPLKFYVPFEVQKRGIDPRAVQLRDTMRRDMANMQRALTVASATGGGNLVATNLVSFIDLLRNRAAAYRMGARPLTGLVGNVAVPKLTAAGTAYWLGTESTQITPSQQTVGQLTMSPKNVGGYTEISRQLLLQSTPDAEGIVNADLATIVALAVDLGALNGSGSGGQPTGILQTAGIGTASGMSTIAYAGVLDFQYQCWNSNVTPENGGYVSHGDVAKLLMTRVKFANTASPLWDGTLWDGVVAGFPGMSTKQMAAGTMLFGAWDQLLIGEWGVLEIEVNPFANFQAGIIGVRAFMTVDIGLRYPAAFTAGSSIT